MRNENDDKKDGDATPPPLQNFGHYQLLKELGRGAQGVVYLAEDVKLHRKVALKMLAAARAQVSDVRERFQREAELASKLEHPGICGVHEFGEVEGIPFIAMQYIPGMPLSDMIEEAQERGGASSSGASRRFESGTSLTGKDSLQDILEIVEQTARALHEAHEVGLLHRDIKPANIMIAADGHPVILDFGLARDLGDDGHTLTESGQALGTPAYMAGEQILGQRDLVDRRTDVYALGVTLYECLTLHRPFEAEGFEQLYHEILQGAPTRPRKHNPRIPQDLGTVVEVAMDRDPDRRYATALELAEDLRRVRSFEPIQAKPAGVLTRTHKWVRRKPAPAVTLAAGFLFVVAGSGVLVQRDMREHHNFERDVAQGTAAVESGDVRSAIEALGRARNLRPEAPRVFELSAAVEDLQAQLNAEARREEALVAANAARIESVGHQRAYADHRATLDLLLEELDAERGEVFADYAQPSDRASFAEREEELRRIEVEAEKLLLDAREALERAARFESPWGMTDETRTAFASFFLSRWREAVSGGDIERAALFREAVEDYDVNGEHLRELLGRSTLSVEVTPPGAELHLFRYVPYAQLRPGRDVPRLVPVPTAGLGSLAEQRWAGEFAPGDPCLVIDAVDAESPAARAGLRPGDLVLYLNDAPSAQAMFTAAADPNAPQRRMVSVAGHEIRDGVDWFAAVPEDAREVEVLLEGEPTALHIDHFDLNPRSGKRLAEQGCEFTNTSLRCLSGERIIDLELPPGTASGLRCRETVYPLIRETSNRIDFSSGLTLDPGSYLIVARAPGHEEQRLPVLVGRLAEERRKIQLLPEGSTPPGFVYVPPGVALLGGDPQAIEPLPAREVEVEGFFIQRRELSNADWNEFLEDPEIAARIEASPKPIYVPRERSGPMPIENLGGPNTPVMGVSWEDLRDYLEWRNELAVTRNEPWVFDLPSEDEWEKAARGADGRVFPWGSRFDYAATVGLHSRAIPLFDAPGGIELRDESPYGVLDAAGHRQEWTRDEYVLDPEAPTIYRWRGGSWRSTREQEFRLASRGYGLASFAGGTVGARLIARPRKER